MTNLKHPARWRQHYQHCLELHPRSPETTAGRHLIRRYPIHAAWADLLAELAGIGGRGR